MMHLSTLARPTTREVLRDAGSDGELRPSRQNESYAYGSRRKLRRILRLLGRRQH